MADAAWTAIGLAIGTYLNWLIVSKCLRRYSVRADNSITLPELFSTLFGVPYQLMMVVGAIFVLLYTVLGGFLAESVSDFMQAIVMLAALSVIVIVGIIQAGGLGAVMENAREIPGFFEFFGLATPHCGC